MRVHRSVPWPGPPRERVTRSEELAKEGFSRSDVNVDLNMTTIGPLDGLKQVEYLKDFGDIYKCLEKRLEPVLVNQEQ